MSETVLQKVFNDLKEKKIVSTQTDFGNLMGLTKGYVSQLMKQSTELPEKVRRVLHDKFDIDSTWLVTNGETSSMHPDLNGSPVPLKLNNVQTINHLLDLLEKEKDMVVRLQDVIAQKDERIAELTDRLTTHKTQ